MITYLSIIDVNSFNLSYVWKSFSWSLEGDFDAIKAEESKEGVEIAESVVKEELVDKAIYDIVSQYISDDAIKQNVLRIITRQTEYIDWANKEATISDLRRKIKRSLSLQSISSDVATQSARNMVSQLVNLYVKK